MKQDARIKQLEAERDMAQRVVEAKDVELKNAVRIGCENITAREKERESETLKEAVYYLEKAAPLFKYQKAGKEFEPNREGLEATMARIKSLLPHPAENEGEKPR